MKQRNVTTGVLILLAVVLSSINVFGNPPVKYTPEGTWEYSVPGVPPEYSAGVMVIGETEEGFKVTVGPSTDYLMEAQSVEYSKKSLSFKIYVEYEEIIITGTFKGDEFTGTVSYVEGIFDMTAKRNKPE